VIGIHAGSVDADPAKWLVTQKMLEHEIAKVKNAKAEHSGEKAEEPEEDWVSAELIGGEIAFDGAGSGWAWM
jgi:hypothetical protein